MAETTMLVYGWEVRVGDKIGSAEVTEVYFDGIENRTVVVTDRMSFRFGEFDRVQVSL